MQENKEKARALIEDTYSKLCMVKKDKDKKLIAILEIYLNGAVALYEEAYNEWVRLDVSTEEEVVYEAKS